MSAWQPIRIASTNSHLNVMSTDSWVYAIMVDGAKAD
jgi:hypothetical protein